MVVDLTEKWLMEAGGWAAMKAARSIVESEGVLEVNYRDGRLTGLVRGPNGKPMASGAVIKSRTDITTLCSCAEARRYGTLCAHTIALALVWIKNGQSPKTRSTSSSPAPAAEPLTAKKAMATIPPAPALPAQPLKFDFPPNALAGLQRGRLTVSLSPLKKDKDTSGVSLADEAFFRWLTAQKMTSLPNYLSLSEPHQITSFLLAIAGHPHLRLGQNPLTITDTPTRLWLKISQPRDDGARLQLLKPEKSTLLWPAAPGDVGWVALETEAIWCPWPLAPELFELVAERGANDQPRPLDKSTRWLLQRAEALSASCQFAPGAEAFLAALRRQTATPQIHVSIDGSLERLTLQILIHYPGLQQPIPPVDPVPGIFPYASAEEPNVFFDRDLEAEKAALHEIEACGFVLTPATRQFVLRGRDRILELYADTLRQWEKKWDVSYSADFREATRHIERVEPLASYVSSGADWLSFDVTYRSDNGATVSRAEIHRLLRTGQGQTKLPNGKVLVTSLQRLQELEDILRDIEPDQSSGNFRVAAHHTGYLETSLGLAHPELPALKPDFSQPARYLDASLVEKLRDYQKHGIAWLWHQAQLGRGGILADEMGLGKTVQTLGFIAAQQKHAGAARQPALVICPRSLLGNWRDEAAKFTPHLRTLVITGAQRHQHWPTLAQHDLIITSYALVARDLENYRGLTFSSVVLDEASYIRNPETQSSRAVRQIKTQAAFALTGTPIENGVRDLWSITNFALPGYLGKRKDFVDRYEKPISEGTQTPTLLNRLRQRLAPYILRRVKREVAKDLPTKIEKIIRCPLSPAQTEIYKRLVEEGSDLVREARRTRSAAQARLTMLTTLLRLRQVCCDLRLIDAQVTMDSSTEDEEPTTSGKISALRELMEEIRDGGHSVLIFSQFASMLRLLKFEAESHDLAPRYLDGSTRDRDAEVRAFRDDPACRAFLISLKAGGFGLNLTKADTVVLYDPWWNPAVEDQACDRAHRLGQERPVTIYRLICENTVEEKILALQSKKRGLVGAAFDDTAPTFDGLSTDELEELLS